MAPLDCRMQILQRHSSHSSRSHSISATMWTISTLLLLILTLLHSLPLISAQCMQSSYALQLVDSSNPCYRPSGVASMNGLTVISCFTGGTQAWNASSYTSIGVTLIVPSAPNGNVVNFDPTGGLMYVSTAYKGVYRYNTTDGSVIPFMSSTVCLNPQAVLTATVLGQPSVFAICKYNYPLGVVRVSLNGTLLEQMIDVELCAGMSGMLIRGNYGYITCGSTVGNAAMVMFDLRNSSAVSIVLNSSTCFGAYAAILHPITGDIHVACYASSNLVALDQANNVKPIPLSTQCSNPRGLYYDPQNRFHIYLCVQGGVMVNTFQTNIPLVSLASAVVCPAPWAIARFSPPSPLDRQLSFLLACNGDAPVLLFGRVVMTFKTDTVCQLATTTLRVSNGDYYTTCWGSVGYYSGALIELSGGKISTILDFNLCPNPTDLELINATRTDFLLACGSSFLAAWVNGSYVSPNSNVLCIAPQYLEKDFTRNIIYASCATGVTYFNPLTFDVQMSVNTTVCSAPNHILVEERTGDLFADCNGILTRIITPRAPRPTVVQYMAMNRICATIQDLQWARENELLIACNGYSVLVLNTTNVNYTSPNYRPLNILVDTCAFVKSVLYDPGTQLVTYACEGSGIRAVHIDANLPSFEIVSPEDCPTPSKLSRDPIDQSLTVNCGTNGVTMISLDYRCNAGTYWTQGQCINCPLNTYRTREMVSSFTQCEPCPRGQLTSATGSLSCDSCPIGTYENSRYCLSCPPGSSNNITGVQSCQACGPGTYSSQLGATACLACDVGKYSSRDANTGCGLCPLGRYQPFIGQTVCLECTAGNYSGGAGWTECKICDVGKISTSPNPSTCVPCPPGEFQSSQGQSACQVCDRGFFSESPGSAICHDCLPGSAVNSSAALTCPLCAPGRYAAGRNAITCVAADIGYFVPSSGASAQTACEAGYVSAVPGSVSCSPCLPGLYQPQGGMSICASCDPGRYASETASVTCAECDSGYYATLPESFSCTACTRGTASNVTGRDRVCDPCPPGYYQNGLGKSTCVECEPQSYSDRPGAASCARCNAQVTPDRTACNSTVCQANWQYSYTLGKCTVCPLGYGSPPGSICQPCVLNTYTPVRGMPCISCLLPGMDGLSCSGGLASVRAGYWPYIALTEGVKDVQGNLLSGPVALFATSICPIGFCPGAQLQQPDLIVNGTVVIPTQNQSDPNSAAWTGFSSSTSLCVPPRVNSPDNIFCGECEPGYVEWGDKCVACDGPNGGLIFFIIIFSLLLVLLLVHTSRGRSTAEISILMFFVQICALQLDTTELLAWIRVANFALTSAPTCIAPISPQQQTLLGVMLPFILIAEVLFLAGTHRLIATCLKYRQSQQPPPSRAYSHSQSQNGDGSGGGGGSGHVSGTSSVAISRGTSLRDLGRSAASSIDDSSFALPPTSSGFVVTSTANTQDDGTYAGRVASWTGSFFRTYERNTYYSGALVVLQFSYIQVAKSIFEYLYCKSIGNKRLQFSAPTVDCDADSYKVYLVPVILVLIIFVIGFPVASIAVCAYNKEKLYQHHMKQQEEKQARSRQASTHGDENGTHGGEEAEKPDSSHTPASLSVPSSPSGVSFHASASIFSVHSNALAPALNGGTVGGASGTVFPSSPALSQPHFSSSSRFSSSDTFIDRYSPLFRHYRHSAWYWSSLVLLRRASFALLSVLLIEQRVLKNLAFTFMHIAAMQLQQWVTPYDSKRINNIEQIMQLLMVAVSVLLTAQDLPPPYPTSVQIGLFFLVVPPAATLALYIIFIKYRIIKKELEERKQRKKRHRGKLSVNAHQMQELQRHADLQEQKEQNDEALEHDSNPSTPQPQVVASTANAGVRRQSVLPLSGELKSKPAEHMHSSPEEHEYAQPSARLSLSPPIPAIHHQQQQQHHPGAEVELTNFDQRPPAPHHPPPPPPRPPTTAAENDDSTRTGMMSSHQLRSDDVESYQL